MGQYYNLACPEMNMCINAGALGGFVKAREQVWDTHVGAALSLACAAGFGAHPRDLPWAPTGTWAGKRPMMIGDYAKVGDLRNNPALPNDGPGEPSYYNAAKTGKPSPRARTSMTCIAFAFMPTLERVCKMRCTSHDITGKAHNARSYYIEMVAPVSLQNGDWAIDTSDLKTQKERQEYLDYVNRVDPHGQHKRPPMLMEGAPDEVPTPAQSGPGGAGLWVSLDGREFIDPARMQGTDLASIATTQEISGFVMATLFHPYSRGGGDYHTDGDLGVVGRWRGDRLVLMGPAGFTQGKSTLGQEEVRSTFTDITDLAILWAKIHDDLSEPEEEVATLSFGECTPAQKDMARIAILSTKNAFEKEMDALFGKDISVYVRPATTARFKNKCYAVPHYVSLAVDDSKIWLTGEERNALIAGLPPRAPKERVNITKNERNLCVPPLGVYEITMPIQTNHDILSVLARA